MNRPLQPNTFIAAAFVLVSVSAFFLGTVQGRPTIGAASLTPSKDPSDALAETDRLQKPVIATTNELNAIALSDLNQQFQQLTSRLSTIEEALDSQKNDTKSNRPLAETLTENEQRERLYNANLEVLQQFSEQPVDDAWQRETEEQFFENAMNAQVQLEQLGVSITHLECRQDTCRIDLSAGNPKDAGLALAFFPWDTTSEFIPDLDNPSKGTYLVKPTDALVSR